jgi:predicted transcriptional regulator
MSDEYQDAILENMNNELRKLNQSQNELNKILSCFLVIAIKDSTLKTMTANEIKKVMPVINTITKSISENINNG